MWVPLNVRIGFFLAIRQIRRASLWTTSLIIFVMVLTFLNLVVVSGILVGLIQGSINAWHDQYTGDVIISALATKSYIEDSQAIIPLVSSLPGVRAVSPRYGAGVKLEANYQGKKVGDKSDIASAQLIGIDPAAEDRVTNLSDTVIDGSYLSANDFDQVLIGYFLLKEYVLIDSPGFAALSNVRVGSKIRLSVGTTTREVVVKGILKSKVDNVRRGVFMLDREARSFIGRTDGNVAEIATTLTVGTNVAEFRDTLLARGVGDHAKVQTNVDAQPQALKDIVKTFGMLGNVFGSIGLVVASVTIFIVIFINALTRRKYIGILKGIGIHGGAIEVSYVFQSVFYAVIGSLVGLVIVYGFLVPYFMQNPIDFPFSDGILVAPVGETMVRIGLLVVSTLIAGFIPAAMIIRRNTLDSILGRN